MEYRKQKKDSFDPSEQVRFGDTSLVTLSVRPGLPLTGVALREGFRNEKV